MHNLFGKKQDNRSFRSENSKFFTPFVSNNWELFSLRYRDERHLTQCFDRLGLYPNDLIQFSQSKLDDTIHELKRFFFLLIPDDNLFEILNCWAVFLTPRNSL